MVMMKVQFTWYVTLCELGSSCCLFGVACCLSGQGLTVNCNWYVVKVYQSAWCNIPQDLNPCFVIVLFHSFQGPIYWRTQMNFYLHVFSSFSLFVETQCINITTTFSSGKIDICSACKAKCVAVNLFVVCSASLKKKAVLTVLTLCAIENCQKKK